jgi:GH35 family endo-1,4-beta-xylanase
MITPANLATPGWGVLLIFASVTRLAAALPEAEILTGIDQRIATHRQSDAVVSVITPAGTPVRQARVTVRQTRHAFLFGCNIYMWGRNGNARDEIAYRRQFSNVFNFATLGFYWNDQKSQRGQAAHTRNERIARWCVQKQMVPKGHPLVWNQADPKWLPHDVDEIRDLQMAYIDDCMTRFRDLIEVFDVVNEATHFDRARFVQRAPKTSAMWQKFGRIKFTRQCFQQARQGNPAASLLINDYRVDRAYKSLIEKLVDDDGKRLYDVIGIQSHMHEDVWSTAKVWEVCERFATFGVPLHFTEMTITSGKLGLRLARQGKGPWLSTPGREAFQAREVKRFYRLLFSHPAVEAISWWDFTDRGAWQKAPGGLVRMDMSPKPAYQALQKLIKQTWWTDDAATTDADGNAEFRPFYGQHNVTVVVPGQPPVTRSMSVRKGDSNRLVITLP